MGEQSIEAILALRSKSSGCEKTPPETQEGDLPHAEVVATDPCSVELGMDRAVAGALVGALARTLAFAASPGVGCAPDEKSSGFRARSGARMDGVNIVDVANFAYHSGIVIDIRVAVVEVGEV